MAGSRRCRTWLFFCSEENIAWSAKLNNSEMSWFSCWQRYSFLHLLRNLSSLPLSAAEQKPDHAGLAYSSLASTVQRKTSSRQSWWRPWLINFYLSEDMICQPRFQLLNELYRFTIDWDENDLNQTSLTLAVRPENKNASYRKQDRMSAGAVDFETSFCRQVINRIAEQRWKNFDDFSGFIDECMGVFQRNGQPAGWNCDANITLFLASHAKDCIVTNSASVHDWNAIGAQLSLSYNLLRLAFMVISQRVKITPVTASTRGNHRLTCM